MGCAFDMYSQSWNGLSYSMMLFVYCFIMPICVIFFSYIGIIYHTRTSRKGLFGDNESPKKPEIGKVFDRRLRRRQSSHTNQRVSSSIKRTIRGAIFVFIVKLLLYVHNIKTNTRNQNYDITIKSLDAEWDTYGRYKCVLELFALYVRKSHNIYLLSINDIILDNQKHNGLVISFMSNYNPKVSQQLNT